MKKYLSVTDSRFFALVIIFASLPHLAEAAYESADTVIGKCFTSSQYTSYGIELIGQVRYSEAIEALNKALLSDSANAKALNALANIYNDEEKWHEAALYAEKALIADPALPDAYRNVCKAYAGEEEWGKTLAASEKLLRAYPENEWGSYYFTEAENHVRQDFWSKLAVTFFMVLTLLVFVALYFKKAGPEPASFPPTSKMGLFDIFIISASVSCVLYVIFFHFAPLIRRTHVTIEPAEITRFSRYYFFERDGWESYVLYGMATLGLLFSALLTRFIAGIKSKMNYYLIFTPLALLWLLYLKNTGFYPPSPAPASNPEDALILCSGTTALTAVLYYINKYWPKIIAFAVGIILFPVCFIATMPISMIDYSYILTPSLRLLYGFKLSEIYFLYDLLLSLIGLLWMKLNLDINQLQVIGQLSCYLFFFGIFLFSQKLFRNKNLPVFLLIFIVIVRSYANIYDPSTSMAGTPLRLDLWFILLLLVNRKTPYHWIVGLATGLMIVFHRTFGIIYLGAYLQLLFILFILDAGAKTTGVPWPVHVKEILKKHFFLSIKNMLIIICALITSTVLFQGFMPEILKLSMKLGVGMLPVSKISFYWYVPLILGPLAVLLFRTRSILPSSYFITGIFLVLLTIGNCTYFYGRSAESNIINISAILALAFFTFLDTVGVYITMSPTVKRMKTGLPPKNEMKTAGKPAISYNRKLLLLQPVPIISILLAVLFYGDRIKNKIAGQYENLQAGRFIYPLPDTGIKFSSIQELTNGSREVYFLDSHNDFELYYYGNYVPQGYFNPCHTWIIKKDFASFLQQLLDKHYYLVTTEFEAIQEILPGLDFNRMSEKDGYTAISKEKVYPLLADDNNTVLHLALKDSLTSHGMTRNAVQLNKQFTIQSLLKPASFQPPNAIILDNMDDALDDKGFALQQSGSQTNDYLFGYGNTKQWFQTPAFHLSEEQWHYLVITSDQRMIKIYDNGALLTSYPDNSAMVNSGMPIVIGAFSGKDVRFRGTIGEIELTNGAMDEQSIQTQWQLISRKL